MTVEEFDKTVQDWIDTARHPRFNRPYTELVYQPMLELLAYLRANGFKTFIVSGGGIEFMRPGPRRPTAFRPSRSSARRASSSYEFGEDGKPVLMKAAEGRVHRRRPGQAGRHQPLHRPAAELRLRQFGRRPADAAMDRGRRPRPLHGASSTTTTPNANGPTTASRTSAGSTRPGTRRSNAAGPSSSMKNDWKVIYPFEKR